MPLIMKGFTLVKWLRTGHPVLCKGLCFRPVRNLQAIDGH